MILPNSANSVPIHAVGFPIPESCQIQQIAVKGANSGACAKFTKFMQKFNVSRFRQLKVSVIFGVKS
jgi:hypothetical protein